MEDTRVAQYMPTKWACLDLRECFEGEFIWSNRVLSTCLQRTLHGSLLTRLGEVKARGNGPF